MNTFVRAFVRECNNVGNFARMLFTGRGTIVESDESAYDGQWKLTLRGLMYNGQGTLTWADGSKYEGQLEGGKRHGQGTLTWADGSKYEGQWKNDAPYKTTEKFPTQNSVDTLVFRSTKLSSENRPLLYEKYKFLPNGKEIDVNVVGNPQEFLIELQSSFDKYKKMHDKTLETFRLVIDQHGGENGYNDIQINKNAANEILKAIVESGVTKLIISDGSCYGAMKHAFSDELLAELGQGHFNSVRRYSAPDNRICMKSLKGEDVLTVATLGPDGDPKPRERTEFQIIDEKVIKIFRDVDLITTKSFVTLI